MRTEDSTSPPSSEDDPVRPWRDAIGEMEDPIERAGDWICIMGVVAESGAKVGLGDREARALHRLALDAQDSLDTLKARFDQAFAASR